ncbi:MAG: class I SAM-dependent methyltransferase [Bacteroidetes bacterium]|nr:class I SAM-dependent methyltransferase [Bacteroidota bacterium]
MDLSTLQQPQLRQWILEHEHDEPAQLMLSAHLYPHIPLREAVQQIQARQKARLKLPQWYAQQGVIMPPPLSVEQASSEDTALYKAHLLHQRLLEKNSSSNTPISLTDLTGGMGLDCWAFAQYFGEVTYVELQQEVAAVAAHNFNIFNIDNISICHNTAETYLQQAVQEVDVLYLDPARRDSEKNKVVLLSDCQPDVTRLLPLLLQKAKQVWVKASPMLDIKGAMQELGQQVQEVQVVSLRGEVKELLFRIEARQEPDPLIRAVNLAAGTVSDSFEFRYAEESQARPLVSMPERYLYDPGAALRKAGAFKLPAVRFGLKKLQAHSHLYTSDQLVSTFPGRSFLVQEQLKADRKALHKFLPSGKAHLVVRNFPLKSAVLQKKLRLAEGDPYYIFATTLADGKPQLLLCERI